MMKPHWLVSLSDRNRLYADLLRSGDRETREAALAEIAGQLDDDLAAEILRLFGSSRDGDLRLQLLESLGFELEAGEAEGMEEGGAADQDEEPGERAESGLSRRGCREVKRFLRAVFEEERECGRLRRKALEVAVLAPEPWQEAAVRECWEREEPAWRITALYCMGHLHPVDFTEEIGEGLAAGDSALRAQAIAAADSRGLRSLGPRILRLAADRGHELEVRLGAIEALATLRPPGAAALLAKLRAEPAPFGPFAAGALVSLEQNERAEALLEDWKESELRTPRAPPAGRAAPPPIDSRFL